jgi:hypothetical protein
MRGGVAAEAGAAEAAAAAESAAAEEENARRGRKWRAVAIISFVAPRLTECQRCSAGLTEVDEAATAAAVAPVLAAAQYKRGVSLHVCAEARRPSVVDARAAARCIRSMSVSMCVSCGLFGAAWDA